MKVDLIFVRHGLSCTNSIAKYSSSIKQITRVFHSDPHVSKFGEVDIESIPKGVFPTKPDVLLASCLLRSIETALILFPKGKPIVAPHIKEVGFTAGNRPSTIGTQVSALHKRFQNSDSVNYEYVETAYKNNYRTRHFTKAAVSTDLSKFIEWLQENLHSLLKSKSEPSRRRKITVVVIGHSNFMRKFVPSELNDKPFHLGARKLTYNYLNSTLTIDDTNTRHLKTYLPYRCKSEREEAAGKFKIVSGEKKINEGLLFMGFPLPSKKQFMKFETICHV